MSENPFVRSFLGTETYIKILSRYQVESCMCSQTTKGVLHSIESGSDLRNALAYMLETGCQALNVTNNDEILGQVRLEDISHMFQKGQRTNENQES